MGSRNDKTREDGNFLYYVERHLGGKRAGAWRLWFRHMAHFQGEQEMNKGFGYSGSKMRVNSASQHLSISAAYQRQRRALSREP